MTQPKYRRPLNTKQLTLINQLFRFRFATTKLIAQILNIPQNKAHTRLKILLDQDYISRKNEAGFRQPGQFDIYFLTAKGADTLGNLPTDPRTKSLLRRIAKDAGRSDRFINHCLGVFEILCQLQGRFGDRIRCFTKSELTRYSYFPSPLPDAFIRLGEGEDEKQFFLEYIDASVPTRAALARLEQIDEYYTYGDWEAATPFANPTTIVVVDKPALRRKLRGHIEDGLDEDLLQVTSRSQVRSALERQSNI